MFLSTKKVIVFLFFLISVISYICSILLEERKEKIIMEMESYVFITMGFFNCLFLPGDKILYYNDSVESGFKTESY